MMPHTYRRSRLYAPLRGTALLLLLVAAATGIAFIAHPAATAIPLDPHIPNEQALIDAGLSGAPPSGQPTRPIAVDRVLVDGAATYVQYHMATPSGPPSDPSPTLADDQGVPVTEDIYSGVSSASDWTLPVPLPAWLPWRPPTIQRGYIILAPLPATARAAVLQFGAPGAPPSPDGGEIIRVPLGPRTSALRRVVHPGVTAHAAGLTLALRDLGVAHLTYTYTPQGGPFSPFSQTHMAYGSLASPGDAASDLSGQLVDGAGHPVPTAARGTDCAHAAHGLRCATTVVFPPQPSGAHLTLTIHVLPVGSPFTPTTQRPIQGP